MFEEEAKEYSLKYCNGLVDSNDIEMLEVAYQDGAEFGYERGIGRLRYCCTCKKWVECKVESMYGICADWEIKEVSK